jgi:F420-dependent oxidoreductase-like protein
MTAVEFGIILPQVALSFDDVVARAHACERLGFRSLWFYDHLYAPGLPDVPALEGWTLATAVLAQTQRLRVGHLVLCNNFRHPAVLGKMITTLDVISEGRVEVGIGSGSYEPEHTQAGLPWGAAADRSERLGESLEVLTRMLTGERTTFAGRHYQIEDLPNLPPPVQRPRPPIFIGGSGERFTLPLVARYADGWNVPTYALGEIDRKVDALRVECEQIGRDPASIRRSLEAVVVVAPDDRSLRDARDKAERRFGAPGFGLEVGGFIGTPPAVCDRVGAMVERGFTHFVFFTHDRAHEDTLALLAEEVMAPLGQLDG